MSVLPSKNTSSKKLQARKLKLEQLENRQLLAADFVNYTPVGELSYLYQSEVGSTAGNEETFRIQAKRTGTLTIWSENVSNSGAFDLALYPATNPNVNNPLAQANTGVRKIEINATAGDEYFLHMSAPTNIQNGRLHIANLLSQSGGTATLAAPEPRTTSGVEVKGPNVTRVEYAFQGQQEPGFFQQTGPGTWVETNTNGTKTFTERTARDEWSVYLQNTSGQRVNLDLFRGQVEFATAGSNTFTDLYSIQRTEAVIASNVSAVAYQTQAGTSGTFAEIAPNVWQENTSGGSTFSFTEVSRSGNSVQLRKSDGNNITINLTTYRISGSGFPEFTITSASDVSGYTVNDIQLPNGENYFRTFGNEWFESRDNRASVETSQSAQQLQLTIRENNTVVTFDFATNRVSSTNGFSSSLIASEVDNRLDDSLGGNHNYIANASRTNHSVEINGLRYNLPASTTTQILVLGGSGFDRVTATETGADDSIAAQGNVLQLAGANYQMTFGGVEDTTTIYSGGNDTVTLFDQSNSADHFFSNQTPASVTSAILYGLDGSYRNAVVGFPNIAAQRQSPTGADSGDVAIMRDGPGSDVINVGPGVATMTYGNGGATSTANGYNIVHTYADTGTNDVANFADTATTDTFYADRRVNHTDANGANRSGFAFLNGGSTLFFAGGYNSVNATSSLGGADTAILYDTTGADTFTATPTTIRMQGPGNGFDNMATGFVNNYGYSVLGGNTDLASFTDSSGNDSFIVGSFNAWMDYANGNTTYVTGFYNTTVNGGVGGIDTASLFDSNTNDVLTTYAQRNQVDFWQGFVGGTNWANGYTVNNFGGVFATKTLGGVDTATVSPNDLVNLTLTGAWV